MSLYEKLIAKEAVLAVVGLGYVGMPIAVAFAKKGLNVIGFDTNSKKIEAYRSGVDPTKEVGDEQLDLKPIGTGPYKPDGFDVGVKAALAKGPNKSTFVVYPNSGHAFHADYRPSYRAPEAAEALGARTYYSRYPESPSPRVYGEGAAQAGVVARPLLLGGSGGGRCGRGGDGHVHGISRDYESRFSGYSPVPRPPTV